MSQQHRFDLLRGEVPDGARRGRYTTPHGSFETPCFAPVGTVGSVKGLLPEQVRAAGAELILANTYHLALRPGSELIQAAGGLHRFMDWDGPILTDSGGYQVFSLAGKRVLNDEGVTFWGSDAGKELFLSPARALEIQGQLGSDIAMVLDVCPSYDALERELLEAHRRTLLWATEARRLHRERGGSDAGQAVFGIVQGGRNQNLRTESAAHIVELDFDGIAIGGVSVGETKEQMDRCVSWVTPLLPEDKIRYLMGIGEPDDLFEAVLLGIDMFDCVSPTRHGRCNRVYVPEGQLNMRNAVHREDFGPIQEGCTCPCCSRFTRAYVRHLAMSKEMLAGILQSLHNIHFLEQLMLGLRQHIERGASEADLREWYRLEYPGWQRTQPADRS